MLTPSLACRPPNVTVRSVVCEQASSVTTRAATWSDAVGAGSGGAARRTSWPWPTDVLTVNGVPVAMPSGLRMAVRIRPMAPMIGR